MTAGLSLLDAAAASSGNAATYAANVVSAMSAGCAHGLAALSGWRAITRVDQVWDYPGRLGRQAWLREVARAVGRRVPDPGAAERLAALHTALVLSTVVSAIWWVLTVVQIKTVMTAAHETADWPWMLNHTLAGLCIVLFHAHAGRRIVGASGPAPTEDAACFETS